MKKILKQDRNSRQRQYIVPVSNLKARKIKTLLSLPIHLAHHPIAAASVALLSLRCRSAVAPLPLLSLLLLLLLSLLLSLRFRSAVAPLSISCRSADANVALLPFLSLLLLLSCHSWYRSCCRSTVTPAVALLSLRCHSAIVLLSVRCRSVVAPMPLLSLLLSLFLLLLLSIHFCRLDCSRSSPQEA